MSDWLNYATIREQQRVGTLKRNKKKSNDELQLIRDRCSRRMARALSSESQKAD